MAIADRFAEYANEGVTHISGIPHPWSEAGLDQLADVMVRLRV